MSANKEDIDKLIKETLTQEEMKFYDELDEQNLSQMVGGLFTGKLSWLLILMNVVNVLIFLFSIYCVFSFFETTETNELIKWGSGFFLAWTTMAMIKIFAWLQIDKKAILREMKRLEIQISSLSNKL